MKSRKKRCKLQQVRTKSKRNNELTIPVVNADKIDSMVEFKSASNFESVESLPLGKATEIAPELEPL